MRTTQHVLIQSPAIKTLLLVRILCDLFQRIEQTNQYYYLCFSQNEILYLCIYLCTNINNNIHTITQVMQIFHLMRVKARQFVIVRIY